VRKVKSGDSFEFWVIMKIGLKILRVKSCTSTNDLAKKLALAGEKEGTVILAEEQTKGRGTKGRLWYSAAKKGLYISVILKPSLDLLSLLPLTAGVAVSDACEAALGLRIKLRWPNDLLWRWKKLGGILCETSFSGDRLNYTALGLGLNVNHNQEDFPLDIRHQSTSLKIITNKEVTVNSLLPCLWPALDKWYQALLKGSRKRIIDSFLKKSAFSLGEKLAVLTDEGPFQGLFKGINWEGGLVVDRDGQEKVFFSGEIRRVRIA